MILRGWHIDGFGVFHDRRRADLGDGLTVIEGRNEAGKSTLLAFVRGVLFGFPDRRSRSSQPLYEPVHGGRHGGRLFVEHRGRSYTIARRAGSRNNTATVTDADGQALPEGDLRDLLGGADGTLFRNVFGFSLSELQEADSLTEEGVKDRIFAGAVAGAGRSARAAAKALESAAAEHYSPNARNRSNRVYALLKQRGQIEDELAQAQRAARDYPARREEERAAGQEVERLRNELRRLQARKAELDSLIKLAPEWSAREEAIGRLEDLTGRRFARTEEIAGDPALDALQRQADQLREHLQLQRRRLTQAAELDSARQQDGEALQRALADLGDGWDEGRVAGFTLPIPQQEEIRGWERALADAERAVETARTRRDEADRQVQDAQAQQERLQDELDAFGDPPEAIDALKQRLERLDTLRAQLDAHARAVQAATNAETLAEERDKRLDDLETSDPGRLPLLLAGLLALLALAAAGAAMAFGQAALAGGLAAAGLLGAGALAWDGRRRRRAWRSRVADARRDRDAAHNAAWTRRQERDDAQAAALETARALGLETLPGEAELVRRRAELDRTLERRRQYDAKAKELSDAARTLERLAEQRDAAQETLDAAGRALAEQREAWRAWKAERGFPDSLSPQGTIDFAGKVQAAQKLLKERSGRQRQLDDLRCDIAAWEEAARAVLQARGADPGDGTSGEALILAFETAHRAIAEEQEAHQRIRQAEQALAREAGHDARRTGELRQTLHGGLAADWRRERDETADYLEASDGAYREAVQALERARAARAEVEASDRIAELETRRNALDTQIAEAYRRWQVLTSAQTLIEQTLARYERERQPAVFANASARLARITGGRYTRILQDDDGDGFRVLDHREQPLAPLDLSRGTREQLYLAVRLGLIEEFAARGTRLPLVMDEILVNFDPERMAAVADELHAVARDHQILLFTCHPWVADTLAARGDGATRVRMAAGA